MQKAQARAFHASKINLEQDFLLRLILKSRRILSFPLNFRETLMLVYLMHCKTFHAKFKLNVVKFVGFEIYRKFIELQWEG